MIDEIFLVTGPPLEIPGPFTDPKSRGCETARDSFSCELKYCETTQFTMTATNLAHSVKINEVTSDNVR